MNYLSTDEIAEKWGISARRVTTLCKDNRSAGAVRKSGVWLIPDDAEKPATMKRGRKPSKEL